MPDKKQKKNINNNSDNKIPTTKKEYVQLQKRLRKNMLVDMFKSRDIFLTISLCIMLIWAISSIFTRNSYYGTIFSTACLILSMITIGIYIWPQKKNNDLPFHKIVDSKIWRGFMKVLSVLLIAFNIVYLMPIKISNSHAKTLQDDVVYITYNHKCPYCEVAMPGLKTATRVYTNSFSSKPVQFVNLDSNTPLAKKLSKKVKVFGSVYEQKDDKYITMPYTQKRVVHKDGETKTAPVSVTPSHIFDVITKVNNNVKK